MTYIRSRTLLVCGGLIGLCSMVAADTIIGSVHNRTRGQLAAGDEVILLRLDQADPNHVGLNRTDPNAGMQEEARTSTNSEGWFALSVRYPGSPHLVRVVHQGVNYDRPASVGEAISVDVFDAAVTVQGITGSIEIIRIGSNGNLLHVSDMIEIKNDSSPPLTQSGDRTFEVYLPAQATIDSVLAASSAASPVANQGRTAALISTIPVPGEPGHYTVNFPLRPGATKFAFNYDLPYDGYATFRPKNLYALQQLAVMIPPTMKFTSRSTAFQVLRTGNDRYQVEAANVLKKGDGPGFEISGVGELPALQAEAQSPTKPQIADQPTPAAPASSRAPTQNANGLDTAVAPGILAGLPRMQSRLLWVLMGASVVVLGACGFLLWHRERLAGNKTMKIVQQSQHREERTVSLADALQGELLQLEIDRSLGTITVEEYATAKEALEGTVKRALARAGGR
ncbi:MAG: hypothetical protein ABSB87_16635 [Terriglobales bacterium]|jgi:hypothetical protein